ncbi:uncharacterized protein LOC122048123 [Zingiber officinale]|uniref:uncharacterized protein LOC122048123 n=1 Tax=Zingiber officinale TaxID=94328 RepID=UPI001C4B4870|nr:uncharacterized protein LOC122048123 [Zingiber officinale]
MTPNPDIGWQFGQMVGDNRKTIRCKFCGKVITGGITRLKQYIAHVTGNVEICHKAHKEISSMLRKHLQDSKTSRSSMQRKKQIALDSITQNTRVSESGSSGGDDIEDIENRELQKAIKEGRKTRVIEEQMRNRYGQGFSGSSSGLDPADSGPYNQSMINTIAEAGTGIKGPKGRQIGGVYLQEEVDEINGYLNTLKSKWSKYGCTIMCDGWSTHNKHPIINFMIYCDRNMVFHSSVDCTNKAKTVDFILSLLSKIIDEIGEENIVHVVTDSEGANKVAGAKLMIERQHLFWSPCAAHCIDLMLEDIGKTTKVKKCVEKAKQIMSFIYNSDKVVNLMKTFTNDHELLTLGITQFAIEFISIENLVRHSSDLKRMCTSGDWEADNNTSKRRKEAENIASIIMDGRFWKRAHDICAAIEPLVKVLKLVDQDQKPTMSIIYEAMDRAKMEIKDNTRDWQSYWDIIDN